MSADSTIPPAIRTIKASEFKARCLKLMDEVAESGQEIVITKNGRPVSKLAPIRERPTAPLWSIGAKSVIWAISSPHARGLV